jgi:hypothetical protein
MGGTCGTCWEKRGAARVLWGNLTKRDYLEDLSVGRRILLKWIFKNCDKGKDWIDLAGDRARLPAVFNAITNLWVSYNAKNFLSS